MPPRDAHPGTGAGSSNQHHHHGELRFAISTALMPSLVQERSRRRDALLQEGAPNVAIYTGTGEDDDSSSPAFLRGRHCIVRTMAQHFIVPLSSIDPPTRADITIVRNYEVIDVVKEIAHAIEDTQQILTHRLPLPPSATDDSTSNAPQQHDDSSLEATTLDIWLAPRLVSAAAMLIARAGELELDAQRSQQDTPDDVKDTLDRLHKLHHRITDLLHLVLNNSAEVHGAAHAHFICHGFIQAAELALDRTRATASGPASDNLCFFSNPRTLQPKLYTRTLPPRSKVPMNEAWLPEDQSPFTVALAPAVSSSSKNVSKRSFLYAQALLIHAGLAIQSLGASFAPYVADLADRTLRAVQAEWQHDLSASTSQFTDQRAPIIFERMRASIVRRAAEQAAAAHMRSSSSQPVLVPLLETFSHALIRAVLTDSPQALDLSPILTDTMEPYFLELRQTMQALRSMMSSARHHPDDPSAGKTRWNGSMMMPALRRCLPSLIEIASEGWELGIVEASAVRRPAQEGTSRSLEMRHKMCVFEAILLVLASLDSLQAHALPAEMEALGRLCGEDPNSSAPQQGATATATASASGLTGQDSDEHTWLTRRDRLELQRALHRCRLLLSRKDGDGAQGKRLASAMEEQEQGQDQDQRRAVRRRPRLQRRSDSRPMRVVTLSVLEAMWDAEAEPLVSRGAEQLCHAVELVSKAFCASSNQLRAHLEEPHGTKHLRRLRCQKCDSLDYAATKTSSAPAVDPEPVDGGSDTIRRCCSKAGYSTVLRLLENVATTLPSNEMAAPLLDGVRRCYAHGGESLLLDHALRPTRTIIQKGLRHAKEAARTAAVRLCVVVTQQACSSQVTAARPEIMETIEHIMDGALMPQTEARFKLTNLTLAYQLCKIEHAAVQRRGLRALTLALDGRSIIGDLATDYLLQLHAHHERTIFQMLQPHLEHVIPPLIVKHAEDGRALHALLRLLDQALDTFLRSTMQAVLPVLVSDGHLAAVDLIASALGVSRSKLLLDTMAPFIMAHVVCKPAQGRERALRHYVRLATEGRSGSGSGQGPPLGALLRGTLTEVLGRLLLQFGDERTRANARDALLFVERHMRKAVVRPADDAKALSDLIAPEILSIQHWLIGNLVGVYGKRTMAQRAEFLKGIAALIEVSGSAVNTIRPQILTALTSALSTPELRLDALKAWSQFFTQLPFEDVAPVVGQTASVILDWWAQFSASEKEVATQMLRFAILVHGDALGGHIESIPSLDALETEIPDIARKLRSYRIRQSLEEGLASILIRVGSDNASVSYHSLLDLLTFLQTHRAWIESMTSGNKFGAPITRIVTTLLAAASRLDDEHGAARSVCLRCLGVLGAIDPDRFEQGGDEHTRTILKDFDDKDEAADFGVFVIQHVLVSAFRHAMDARAQHSYAYAIQEMMKYCGLSKSGGGGGAYGEGHAQVPSVSARERWRGIPTSMLDTLTPLASSRYALYEHEWEEAPSPLYKHVASYRKWLIQWARQLTSYVSKPAAHTFFAIVGAAITDQDVMVARFILPHLVLHVLVAGTDDRKTEIRSEMVAVLNDQVDENSAVDEDRRQQSAQTVFQLLDHLNIFIRRKRLETINKSSRKVRQPEASEALINVESIIASIAPELMARASLRCRSYARALLSFETRVRAMKMEAGKADGDIQDYYANMHEIYASVDEPDGMEGVSTRILHPTLEHQIREHEMTGRWTSAQSCWEVKLQQEPESLDSQMGLLRCLRSLGHFDNLRTHIRGVLTRRPEWRGALAAFALESAWSLGEWDDVAESVQRVEELLPEHGIGKAFLCMRDDDTDGFKAAVQEARDLVGKPIFSAGSTGYPQIIDSVTQLHMLHELEMIQAIPKEARQGSGQVADLLSSLRSRLQSSVPSFRGREALLSLRRSAFGVRADIPDLVAEVGRCWTTTSKIARKAGHVQTAYSAVLQASREKAPFAFVQNAKLLASSGDVQHALREVETTLKSKLFRLPGMGAADTVGGSAANAIDLTDSPRGGANGNSSQSTKLSSVDVAKACLLRARLMELAGRFDANEVISSYKQSSKIDPKAEKSWYYVGRYYDSLRDAPLAIPMQHKGFVVRFFLKAAMCGTKYFYRTMPRIATIWLDAGEDSVLVKASKLGRPIEKTAETMEAYQKQELFYQMNERVRKAYIKVPAYQWYGIFPQLVSRVIHKNETVWQVLQELIAFVVRTFPEQAMWSMVAGAQSKDEDRSRRMIRVLNKVKADAKRDGNDTVDSIVDRSRGLAEQLLNLCELHVKSANSLTLSSHIPSLGERNFRNLLIPLQDSIVINLPTDFSSRADHQGFPSEAPRIRHFEERIEIMSSLQKPRKIGIKGTDGRIYNFLCKPKDDLRKDARLMEFDSMINKFLQSNAESRRRRLHIRTYAVVTLNEECGFIEWVPHTVGFRHILTTLYASRGIALYTPEIKPMLDEARMSPDHRRSIEIFESRLLVKYPPVFHEWFLATFSEPAAWMKARLSYARTAAVMSMVGWVLGLGDRHGENILFDATSGDTVHVDFNCLFEKGQTFEIPEKVPFRLTQNMVDALGVTGVEGVYRRACEIAMGILRENKDSLMSVLDAMIHDPLVDFGSANDEGKRRRHHHHQHHHNHGGGGGGGAGGAHPPAPPQDRLDPRVIAARQNLAPIERKLEGVLLSKLDTVRPFMGVGASMGADHGFSGAGVGVGSSSLAPGLGVHGHGYGPVGRYGDPSVGTGGGKGSTTTTEATTTAPMAAAVGLPTHELVDLLIREATSSLLLSKMYVGWAPYL